jgi:hypothetical protein
VKRRVLPYAAALLVATGCGSDTPRTPTAPEAPRTTTSVPAPPSASLRLTGVVTDDEGRSVSGASVTVHPSGGNVVSTTTDMTGAYTVEFDTRANAVFSTGFLVVSQPGYEQYSRYLNLAANGQIAQNLHLHRLTRIAAGAVTSIVVAPADSSCGLSDEWVCRTVRVTTAAPGTLTLTLASDPPTRQVRFCVSEASVPFQCDPSSLAFRVSAGAEVIVELDLVWTATQDERLTLSTSLEPQ